MLTREALGLTYKETLDSSFTLVEAMMQEYAYMMKERNKAVKGKTDDEDFEWVELPSFDNPNEVIRYKKYRDVGDKIRM